MVALYRVAVEGWSQEEAVKEMTQGGFGFHGIWDDLIAWIKGLDIEEIKKKAGIQQSKGGQDCPCSGRAPWPQPWRG